MKLSAIQDTLHTLGRTPKQSLGQNFLHDQNLCAWIVDQLELAPGEPWVELGPGLGALTEFAAARSAHGLLIEKDGRLIDFLRAQYHQLEILHGDAAEYDARELFARGPVKVVGNLPYYVSSQILFNFTQEPSPVARLVLTLQKEMAQRLCAEPRTKSYGALTLLVGRRWHVRLARILPASVFTPVPTVDSAVVVLTPRPADEVPPCDGARFNRLVKRGFARRRKLLRKNLGDEFPDWPALCAAVGLPETMRAEELSLEQWITLANFSPDRPAPDGSLAQDVHGELFDVVDEQDRVIGQASRHEVHARELRHRAVHVFTFNGRGELFLQLRSRWKDKHPRRWDSSAAGHVDAGQDYADTAPRELREELGIDAPCVLLDRIPASADTGWEFVELFRAEHDGPFRLAPAEIESGGFFTLDQIDRWARARPDDFASGFLACYRRFRGAALL